MKFFSFFILSLCAVILCVSHNKQKPYNNLLKKKKSFDLPSKTNFKTNLKNHLKSVRERLRIINNQTSSNQSLFTPTISQHFHIGYIRASDLLKLTNSLSLENNNNFSTIFSTKQVNLNQNDKTPKPNKKNTIMLLNSSSSSPLTSSFSSPSSTVTPVPVSSSTLSPLPTLPSTTTLKQAIKTTTFRPATLKAATLKPATLKPATLKPATLKPATLKPATLKPATLKPADLKLSTLTPTTAKPIISSSLPQRTSLKSSINSKNKVFSKSVPFTLSPTTLQTINNNNIKKLKKSNFLKDDDESNNSFVEQLNSSFGGFGTRNNKTLFKTTTSFSIDSLEDDDLQSITLDAMNEKFDESLDENFSKKLSENFDENKKSNEREIEVEPLDDEFNFRNYGDNFNEIEIIDTKKKLNTLLIQPFPQTATCACAPLVLSYGEVKSYNGNEINENENNENNESELQYFAKEFSAETFFIEFPFLLNHLRQSIMKSNNFTLFLPSDEAFHRLPNKLINYWRNNPDQLKVVFDNHLILEGSYKLIDLLKASTLNASISILRFQHYRNDTFTVNGQRVLYGNQQLSNNGLLHILDGILYPIADKNLLETLKSCNKFDGFITLAQGTGLSEILIQPGPFTLFVPSNEALQKIPDSDLDVIRNNMTALKEFLSYHVVNGSYYSNDLRDGQFISTLLGDHQIQVGVRVDHCLRRLIDANVSPLYRTDIPASNGVIHIVDWILKPSDHEWCEKAILPR